MRPLSPRLTGLLCLLTTSIGWGLNWPAMKLLLREWPPLFSRGCAGLAAGLIVAALALKAGQSLRVASELRGRLLLAAFTNVFAWMGFSTLGMRWLSVAQAALVVYSMPVWATLLSWPLQGRRPGVAAIGGLLLCLSGIGVLFGGQDMGLQAGQLPGLLYCLAAALIFAFGAVAQAPLPLPPLSALAWQLGLGCAPMVILGLLFEAPDLLHLSTVGIGVMFYMTLIPMFVCYLAWFAALRRLPAASASIGTLLTPVVGIASAAPILGEAFGWREGVALALTISGVTLAMRFASGKTEPAEGSIKGPAKGAATTQRDR